MDRRKAELGMSKLLISLFFLSMAALSAARAESDSGEDAAKPSLPIQVDEERRVGQQALAAALKRGEIRPLDEVLRVVGERFPGDVIEIEPERHGPRWVYEIKVLGNDGLRRTVGGDGGRLGIAGG